MVTQETLIQKILDHLNGQLSQSDLVHWAETAFVELTESNSDVPNEEKVLNALTYIGAGDSPGFPLTWEVLSGFLEGLGTKVRVIAD